MISGHNIFPIRQSWVHGENFPAIAQVENYWHCLRGQSHLPYRNAVDPRGIDSALAFAFVLERIAPGIGRFRIAGRHLGELMGFDVRGMPISEMFSADSRRQIGRIIETVSGEPCIKRLFLSGGKSIGRGDLQGKMFLAPLLDDAGQVTRLLGCLQTDGTIGRQPRRFTISEVHTRSLEAPKSGEFPQTAAKHLVGFSETGTSPKPVATGRQSKLQLVVNNA